MSTKTILLIVVITAGLMAGGLSFYQLGFSNGETHALSVGSTETKRTTQVVDPSTWGIAEGEVASKRHIEAGLKAGDIDPVTERKILYYHDPMVPGNKFEAPGKSPFMDMMLVPTYAGAESSDNSTVSVSSRIQQNLGVRTGEVMQAQWTPELSAVGTVAWNDRSQFMVQARATGFVEKLHVRTALDPVSKGQSLLELYVPDWVAAQQDYLTTLGLKTEGLERLTQAALQRMRQAGMTETQISQVKSTRQVHARITLSAPASGVITELMVRDGATVTMGTPLMRINSLSSLWVEAEIPESLTAQVRVGSEVEAQTAALPAEVFRGQVQALLPEINPTTRTRKARMVLDNPHELLVPGMFVQMKLSGGPARTALVVPSEALVRTGQRTLVIGVENEAFRPFEVRIGYEQNGQTEILSGLKQGQKIVLSGQFLIDSEANLKGVEGRWSLDKKQGSVTPEAQSYHTSALVEAVADETLTLTHPEIPALKWPGMTMDFRLAPDHSSIKPEVGSTIQIEFLLPEDEAPLIIQWQPEQNKANGGEQ
ncbi:efflux RND transporter periplasmic adaptor subunit [Rheinheimera faecalis]|uniref:efflux RND transporter periplasmic adaptor subunit n=1 Tax=Rheinheimera faecalis TaxID=2901141 RepID=UPI001E5BB97C|nr:efflux RND transporter periplasmic adaptor subunit [Rheinheimera faecalis]